MDVLDWIKNDHLRLILNKDIFIYESFLIKTCRQATEILFGWHINVTWNTQC